MAQQLLHATHTPAEADSMAAGTSKASLSLHDLESLKAAALAVAADTRSYKKAVAARDMEEFALPDGQVKQSTAKKVFPYQGPG